MNEIVAVILGSAVIGAVISSLVNGAFNWRIKNAELERRDMEMALKMADLKHQQMLVTHDWYAKQGQDVGVTFPDPLISVIDYCGAVREYSRTGRWAKGEANRAPRTSN